MNLLNKIEKIAEEKIMEFGLTEAIDITIKLTDLEYEEFHNKTEEELEKIKGDSLFWELEDNTLYVGWDLEN